MSYAHTDLTDFKFYKAISKNFNEVTDFFNDEINEQEDELNTFEYKDDSNLIKNNKETSKVGNEIIMENYFNFNDEDLQKTLKMKVRVIIEQEIINYDHEKKNYDINALLNFNFNEDKFELNSKKNMNKNSHLF
ncbi:hypothetical protein C1645_732745 [Glomus cerebriforme]|uniref:Uncharacterized protein n=1 Tax=Glomus cerebriforme TaxID=658196 RepID=A0A397TPS8_9GLOM|nr:hypothetical protein C1645_732745 [Glomus cerebriforme]